jgi:hypothetical protein
MMCAGIATLVLLSALTACYGQKPLLFIVVAQLTQFCDVSRDHCGSPPQGYNCWGPRHQVLTQLLTLLCHLHAFFFRCHRSKIVEGRLAKARDTMALLNQDSLRDPTKKVSEVIKESIAALGENVKVSRSCIIYCILQNY